MAQELSHLTGESMTTAATIAMRERLERLRKDRELDERIAHTMAIASRMRKRLGKAFLDGNPDEMHYDEKGLIK